MSRYRKKIEKNINSLTFIYERNKVNFELSFEQQANLIDKNNSEMHISVYLNEKDGIICPKRGEKIELNTKELNDIILTYNELKDSVKGIKYQLDNMIKSSLEEQVNVQLKNINIVINNKNDVFAKNNERLKYLINKLNNINYKNKTVLKSLKDIKSKDIKKVDKSQFKEEELEDPDCVESLNTLSVLEFKRDKYEEIRNKIDGRTPRELLQRIIKIKCKFQELENSLGDDISPQEYLTLLKVTFEHDKRLAEYFKQIGDFKKF